MTKIKGTNLRGSAYEALVDTLLEKAGFTPTQPTYQNPTLLSKIKGRAAAHQIDCKKEYSVFIPFIYPLRILVEVKGWRYTVGTPSIRSFLSTVNDIKEFGSRIYAHTTAERVINYGNHLIEKYNDIALFFSFKGYKQPAEEFGLFHGINLITHENNLYIPKVTGKLEDLLLKIPEINVKMSKKQLAFILLDKSSTLPESLITDEITQTRNQLLDQLDKLTSIIASLDGRISIHVLSEEENPYDYVGTQMTGTITKATDGYFELEVKLKNNKSFKGSFSLPSTYENYIKYYILTAQNYPKKQFRKRFPTYQKPLNYIDALFSKPNTVPKLARIILTNQNPYGERVEQK